MQHQARFVQDLSIGKCGFATPSENEPSTSGLTNPKNRRGFMRLLSGNKTKGKTLFRTLPQNITNSQVRSGVFEKSTHHFFDGEWGRRQFAGGCSQMANGLHAVVAVCVVVARPATARNSFHLRVG